MNTNTRTNKIARALATTYGVELTFMHNWPEKLYRDTNGKVKIDHDTMNGAYASALSTILRERNISVHDCGTDPSCVEVPTNPYDTRKELMDNITAITRAARSLGLKGQQAHCPGGGAHVHSGIPYAYSYGDDDEDDRKHKRYVKLMHVFSANNPWLPLAFAHKTDNYNAPPMTRDELFPDDGAEYERRLKDAERQRENYKERGEDVVKQLHTRSIWGDPMRRALYERRVRDCVQYYMHYRLRIASYTKSLEKIYELRKGELLFKDMRLDDRKYTAIAYRGATIEFRFFLMPRAPKEHWKHIALVDAIVRKIKAQTEQGGEKVGASFGYSRAEINTMKYSVARAGFHAMLTDLGFDPADFRSETINIALKIRYARTHGGHCRG